MNAGLINRLINLVRKTGHRVVFGDPETGQAVVVMDLAEYEQLIGADKVEKPEAYDSHVNKMHQENFPRKEVRAHLPEESFEAVIENEPSEPQRIEVKHEENQQQSRGNDLTGGGAASNINREIGGQKTRSGKRRNKGNNRPTPPPRNEPVNQPAVQPSAPEIPQSEPEPELDDEERFYLEPLE